MQHVCVDICFCLVLRFSAKREAETEREREREKERERERERETDREVEIVRTYQSECPAEGLVFNALQKGLLSMPCRRA